jgi:hypothetical protein
MHATNELARPGDTMRCTVRGIDITLQVSIEGHIARTVMAGPHRVAELCTSYTDARTARAHARQLAEAIRDGVNIPTLIDNQACAEADLLAEVRRIVTHEAMQIAAANPNTVAGAREFNRLRATLPAEDTDELAARINADWDWSTAVQDAEQAAINQDIANLLGRPIGDKTPTNADKWCPIHYCLMPCIKCAKKSHHLLPAEAAANPDDWCLLHGLRKPCMKCLMARTPRQVRATLAGAHLEPPSAPQLREINRHRNGVLYVGGGVTPAMLRSLARKGLGVITWKSGMGRRQIPESLTLNARGLALVAVTV